MGYRYVLDSLMSTFKGLSISLLGNLWRAYYHISMIIIDVKKLVTFCSGNP